MRFRQYLILFILGCAVSISIASLEKWPGYMDADYYFAGGKRLAAGFGFSEIILWNYLDDPSGLPHPSHGYWMPLTSIIVAAGMKILGDLSFSAGRTGFILIAGLLPPVTAALAYSFRKRRFDAIFAGLIAVFSGFYAVYLVTTDAFGIYALLGGVIMLILGWVSGNPDKKIIGYLSMGLLTGMMYLTRTDGAVWLLVILGSRLAAWIAAQRKTGDGSQVKDQVGLRRLIVELAALGSGFSVVVSVWLARNFQLYGSVFVPGGWRVLWLTEYDELFMYPAAGLNIAHWLNSGWTNMLQARWWALGQNLQTTLAVQGMIILLPLILTGMWHYRHDSRVRVGAIIWLATWLLMSLALPFVGARGGFFHAGAALQPLFWAMVPISFERFIQWGVKSRSWQLHKARRGFGAILLASVCAMTAIVTVTRVTGPHLNDLQWGQSGRQYARLNEQLLAEGMSLTEVVMVNNPPGYYAATERAAIVIPYGDVETLLKAAHRYQAKYVILEANHPQPLDSLYKNPGDHIGLNYLATFEDAHIFEIE